MRKFCVCCAALLSFAFSCEPEIEFQDNERLLVKGELVSTNGVALENFPITIFASREYGVYNILSSSFFLNDVQIGRGSTSNRGAFQVTSLSPRNNSSIYLITNFGDFGPADPNYSRLIVDFIDQVEERENAFDLGDISLDRILGFRLTLERITNLTDTLNYTLRYKSKTKYINFGPDLNGNSNLKEEQFGRLTPSELSATEILELREGDTLFLDYELRNVSVIEEGEEHIIISTETDEFNFEF